MLLRMLRWPLLRRLRLLRLLRLLLLRLLRLLRRRLGLVVRCMQLQLGHRFPRLRASFGAARVGGALEGV
jgi:hypothetical protein